MAHKAGIAQAIDEAGGVVPPPRQSQLGLGLPPTPAPARGAGRPLGARNKRTEEFRRELAEGGKMPWQFLAALYRADTVELARRLGCKVAEVLANQRMAAETLMAYTEQKLPVDVNVDGKGVMVFAVEGLARGAALESEQHQGLIEVEGVRVGQPPVGQDGASD